MRALAIIITNNILFQVLHQPLKLKYQCQRQTTWKLAINSLITILGKGLPVAYKDTRTGPYVMKFVCYLNSSLGCMYYP